MLLAAKSAVPLPYQDMPLQHTLLPLLSERSVLVATPPAYVCSASLACNCQYARRPLIWLRLDQSDRDPATFLGGLIAAARRLVPDVGSLTASRMRQFPGPAYGWTPLVETLAGELCAALPPDCVLVVENCQHLAAAHPLLALLNNALVPALPAATTLVLTADQPLPRAVAPGIAVQTGSHDLRLNQDAALELATRFAVPLPEALVRRLTGLSGGRFLILRDVYRIARELGAPLVERAITQAVGVEDLLATLAHAWLAAMATAEQQAAVLLLDLAYLHPMLLPELPLQGPAAPWQQALADGWLHLSPYWHDALRTASRGTIRSAPGLRRQVALRLAASSTPEAAVPLFLAQGDFSAAAALLCDVADSLMSRGQWSTLERWLAELPRDVLRSQPWLVYTRGELAAAQGRSNQARRSFAAASRSFAAVNDVDGVCQSMLAESTLAAWEHDNARAQSLARSAHVLAEQTGLIWHQGWAAWQLGCLAATIGDLDAALASFERATAAAETVGDPTMREVVALTTELATRQRDLLHRREFHRQAYLAAGQAERAAASALCASLQKPPANLSALLGAHGWVHTPLMLKLPAPLLVPAVEPVARGGFWRSLLGRLGLGSAYDRIASREVAVGDLRWPAGRGLPQPAAHHDPLELEPEPVATQYVFLAPAAETTVSRTVDAPAAATLPLVYTEPVQHDAAETPAVTELAAHLLGAFRVTVADATIESWPSGRGRAIFKYLLAHRDRPIVREVLMDMFWPDAHVDAARNNLNVAIHGLRQALRSVTDIPVVNYEDGAYLLNPTLTIWVDIEDFDQHVAAGRQLEEIGQLAAAAVQYESAAGLYQGDLLADDPYEEWPVLLRERLRVAYLDTLDRLGQIYFGQGRYAACANLCQLILARDNCREDAHCRLMRCYARQGQVPMALRQYQKCVEALRDELGVAPAATTQRLYEHIRERAKV